ncbi:MAG: V-type ATP synthase subunit A [Candidatus Lokiarchaeota archaeon]|nr:V-type ATP synthase subunit A [Candidatus Lokiarchaeota archaeon]MBD3198643.1 V-type ATP synthase subunit A [Candidatus Lokiarchaeota archaeon]
MTESNNNNIGFISGINGSLINIKGIETKVRLHDLIKVNKHNIIGEVIQIYSDFVVAQCFENTNNLKLKQKILYLDNPLSMELGPGLLSNVFDGIQRPLEKIFQEDETGFIERGIELPSLSREKKWKFTPLMEVNQIVSGGNVVGKVQETQSITHYIMVPPNINGKITYIVKEGEFAIDEEIYRISNGEVEKSYDMIQKWSTTRSRPFHKRLVPNEPLITGQRVIDLLFPIAKGGTVAVPGGFGTGKTVTQQAIAKWCDADVIVFVSCGERGNEVADVLRQFAELTDPRTNRPLLERIVLIANTSNMPVSARESSIFSGITIAEYYRDMGYHVALQADSTSRWAEALREISGLLEEMPAEGGYPAYLPSRLSSFYERAGIIETIGNDGKKNNNIGSLTVLGSVSPPAGDFSEPVTSNTKRFVQTFWALDAELAYQKHYPAINWLDSYSNYPQYIKNWWKTFNLNWDEINLNWQECRNMMNVILSSENELKNMTQLVGEENLPENQQLDLFTANLMKESILIQNAFDDTDNFTTPTKLLAMIQLILLLYKEGKQLLEEGFIIKDIKDLEIIAKIQRIKNSIPNEDIDEIERIKDKLLNEINSLRRSYRVIR